MSANEAPTLTGWVIRDILITSMLSALCTGAYLWFAATEWTAAAAFGAAIGFITAYMICYMVHEWGHQAGGVCAGANMPLNQYNSILLGQFDINEHSTKQFIWLSWGGIVGYVTVTISTLLIYFQMSLDWVGAGLAVGGLAFVFQSLSVDLPQIFKVLSGADPLETNQHGASGEMILRRTWQSWLVLTAVLIAWNLA